MESKVSLSLGSAGCYGTHNFCPFLKVNDEFVCSRHGKLLKHPRDNQPWRSKMCVDISILFIFGLVAFFGAPSNNPPLDPIPFGITFGSSFVISIRLFIN